MKSNGFDKIIFNLLSIFLLLLSLFLPVVNGAALLVAFFACVCIISSRIWDIYTLHCASTEKPKSILLNGFLGLFPCSLLISFLLYQSAFHSVAIFMPFFCLASLIINNALIPLFLKYEYRISCKEYLYKKDKDWVSVWRMLAFMCGGVSERGVKKPVVNVVATLFGFVICGLICGVLASALAQQLFMNTKFVVMLAHAVNHVGSAASITIVFSSAFIAIALLISAFLACYRFNRKCFVGDYPFFKIKNDNLKPLITPRTTIFVHPSNEPTKKRSPLQLINTIRVDEHCVNDTPVSSALIHDRADLKDDHFMLPSRQ